MNAIVQHEANAIAAHPTGAVAMAGPMGAAIQALQAGMTIDQMHGLMELQERFEANEARKAYVAAMAEFKRTPPTIRKDKEVAFGNTRYSHATLGNVTSVIVDALAKHGISHRWDTKQDGGKVIVTCTLTHSMGHSESTQLEAEPDTSGQKNKIQQIASTVCYLQRYTLLAASGMAVQDQMDDDGQGGIDPMEAPYVDSLIKNLQTTTTDDGALAYWNQNKGEIKSADQYARFKEACIAHRNALKGQAA